MSSTADLLWIMAGFVTLFVVSFALYFFAMGRKDKKSAIDRLKAAGRKQDRTEEEKAAVDALLANTTAIGDRLVTISSGIGSKLVREGSRDYSEKQLMLLRAGYAKKRYVFAYWGLRAAVTAVFAGIAFFLMNRLGPAVENRRLLYTGLAMLVIVGYFIPDLLLRRAVRRRQDLIRRGMPDALDLLVVCVESGLGIEASINRVARELGLSHPILSKEFKLYDLEVRAGWAKEEALGRMAHRIGLVEVDNLASLLIQNEKFGTSLASTLREYAQAFRKKRYMECEEKALKLPAKLMFPLVLNIFPCLVVALMGPTIVDIIRVMGEFAEEFVS